MKFSIQEEEVALPQEGQSGGLAPGELAPGELAPKKQIFFALQEASAQTGLPSKVIWRVLQSGKQKYVRRSDKKVFWIREEGESPFIQVDGKDFFTAEEIREAFGLSRTVFFNQLCKKKTHFLDSQEKSHEVTWKSPRLEKFLSKLREKATVEKLMKSQARKGMPKSYKEISEKMNQTVEDYSLIMF